MSIVNAFLFIGLDLTTRDKLHDLWSNRNLPIKMIVLIATGSLLSFLINRDAGQIAVASFISFALAGSIDTIFYHILRDRTYLVKVNGSNVFGAIADSIAFPTIAFGALLPAIIIGQLAAKVAGGFVWSIILNSQRKEIHP